MIAVYYYWSPHGFLRATYYPFVTKRGRVRKRLPRGWRHATDEDVRRFVAYQPSLSSFLHDQYITDGPTVRLERPDDRRMGDRPAGSARALVRNRPRRSIRNCATHHAPMEPLSRSPTR